jgi:hypothetical protein|tara:strand:- start:5736 stop:6368 length:633 start_codon:yes stop_codon:yes gene_type:complete
MLNRNSRPYLAAITLLSVALSPAALFAAEESVATDESEPGQPAEERPTVYRTIDKHGRVVFSDKRSSNAEKIEVKETVTFQPSAVAKPSRRFPSGKTPSEPDKNKREYETLAIRQPQDDAAIRSNSGNLTVTADLSPALYPNHRLELLMDQEVYLSNQGDAFQLVNLDRGVHVLQLQIVESGSDRVIKASDPVSISILRPSVLQPSRSDG